MLPCGGCTRVVEDGSNWFRSLAPKDVPNLTWRIVSSTLLIKWSWRHSTFGTRTNFGELDNNRFSPSAKIRRNPTITAGPAPIISGRFQLKLSEPSCIGSLHRTRHLRLQSRMENELYSGSTVDCRSEVTSQPHWLNWLFCGWSIPLYGQCFSTSQLLPGIVIFFWFGQSTGDGFIHDAGNASQDGEGRNQCALPGVAAVI